MVEYIVSLNDFQQQLLKLLPQYFRFYENCTCLKALFKKRRRLDEIQSLWSAFPTNYLLQTKCMKLVISSEILRLSLFLHGPPGD